MPNKQHTFGQYETPVDVADLLLGFCLRRPTDRLLDPSCGPGAFLQRADQWQRWLAATPADRPAGSLWGVDVDADAAAAAQDALPHATIQQQNFFTLNPEPGRPFDAVIGNPPYTRAAWFGQLAEQAATQLRFDWAQPADAATGRDLVPAPLWSQLSQRAGLYAYFLLHAVHFLREGGRLGFVLPNVWLDVDYGAALKQFLLDHFKLIAIIESDVERWFHDARVNTCLLVLEACSGPRRRAAHQVRLVQLKRPLAQLLSLPAADYRRPQLVEQLVTRLLPGASRQTADAAIQVVPQHGLTASGRWGSLLRAPIAFHQRLTQPDLAPLAEWAAVQRGYTTGANDFFYLDAAAIDGWGIEPQFRRPLLKSLRGLDRLRLTPAAGRGELLAIPPTADLRGTAAADYVAWGAARGFQQRRSLADRQPWYSLPAQAAAPLLLPKGIWRRHMAPLVDGDIAVDQQLYQIRPDPDVPLLTAAALLNSAWALLQLEMHGRVNFGAGLLWLATYEVAAIRLPDPRRLPPNAAQALGGCFARLAERPCQDIETELDQPDRRALDDAVFDLLRLDAAQRTAVYAALRGRVQSRRRRAASA